MLTLFAVALVVGGIFFVMRKPLNLSSGSTKGGMQPLACLSCGSFSETGGAEGAIVRCADCGVYARVEAGAALSPIKSDFVAPTHVFQTFLPEAPRWPACCSVCSAPPTYSEPMSITYAAEPTADERMAAHLKVGLASLGTMRVAEHHVNVTERYKVPHCDEHKGGAMLVPAGVSFRSYSYFRQFVDANRATLGG